MPVQPPAYDVPTFPPTGNEEVDKALQQWQSGFSQQHRAGQEAVSRTPYIVSTFTNANEANPVSNYVFKKVQLEGGEQVQVSGYFDFLVSAGINFTSAGNATAEEAIGKLKITYPGGTVETNNNQVARHLIRNQGEKSSNIATISSTFVSEATVSFTWPIEARFQTGGEHTFTLLTSGGGSVKHGTLTVLVL